MAIPKVCTNCNWLEGKTYGGNLLVCAMHPYGAVEESCEDFQESDRTSENPYTLAVDHTRHTSYDFANLSSPAAILVGILRSEVERIATSYLREFHPNQFAQVQFSRMRNDFRLQVFLETTIRHTPSQSVAPAFEICQDESEWRSRYDDGTLRRWLEAELEEHILSRTEPVEATRPGGEEEEFWRDIRSVLAQCFPGAGEWSYRKVEREYLPDNLYEFETRSPSGAIVRFRVAACSVFSQEDLLRELVRGIRQTAERTQTTGQFPFLFEDETTDTGSDEEWLYSRLHAVLRRCFSWSERWDIRKTSIRLSRDVAGEAFEFTGQSMHPVHIVVACHGRNKEEKLEELSRKIYEQSRRMRDRPQFRHLFEPLCGMHPYGPDDGACEDFEKSDRPKWVVNIPSREFTSWGVTRFDLSCYNIETAVKVTCSVFATSEELAVHQVRKALCGDAEAKRGIQDLVVSYPPSGEPQFAAPWSAIDAMSEAQIMAVEATPFISGTAPPTSLEP